MIIALALGFLTSPAVATDLKSTDASRFARIALQCITREFPNKPDHVIADAAGVRAPRAMHPAFYGCYDWHSSVHGHWLLARLLKTFPDLPEAGEIRRALGQSLSENNLAGGGGDRNPKETKSFERAYGWARLTETAEGAHPSDGD